MVSADLFDFGSSSECLQVHVEAKSRNFTESGGPTKVPVHIFLLVIIYFTRASDIATFEWKLQNNGKGVGGEFDKKANQQIFALVYPNGEEIKFS